MAAGQKTLTSWVSFTFSHFIDSHYNPTGEPLEDALWMTLIAGGLISGRPLTASHQQEALKWIADMKLDSNARLVYSGLDQRLRREQSGEPPIWEGRIPFMKYAYVTSIFKRIVATEKGYLGMAPLVVKEEDPVCLLQGSRTPFLLRRDGDHYQLVGE